MSFRKPQTIYRKSGGYVDDKYTIGFGQTRMQIRFGSNYELDSFSFPATYSSEMHHYAFVYQEDGGICKFYIDGVLTKEYTGTPIERTLFPVLAMFGTGFIDELRVFGWYSGLDRKLHATY